MKVITYRDIVDLVVAIAIAITITIVQVGRTTSSS